MSVPEKALETISTLVLNWQKTVVITILTIGSTMLLFPILMVCFLLAQASGQLPSAAATAHLRLETNQIAIRDSAYDVAEQLRKRDKVLDARDDAQQDDMRALLRTNLAQCSITASKEKDPRPWLKICMEESEFKQKQLINNEVEKKIK